MSSQTRSERGDTNRLDIRTLAIASAASAVAAIVVSRVWVSGTPVAAAATPVMVTILKEMLDRPTAKIAEKVTVQARALPSTKVREPAASHVGLGSRLDEESAQRLEPDQPLTPDDDGDPADIHVYRKQPAGGIAGRINPKVVAITAALAFVIAGVVLTAGQLAIGNPFGEDGNGALILGQGKRTSNAKDAEQQQQNTTTEQQNAPQQKTPQATPGDQQKKKKAPAKPGQGKQQKTAPQQTTPQATPQGGTEDAPDATQP